MGIIDFILLLAGVSIGLSAGMTVAWTIWRRSGNSGWIDTVWTFTLGGVGIIGALVPSPAGAGWTGRHWLVAAMAAAWALRLGLHIARRTRGITDDPRYAKLAGEWGAAANRQMFVLLQKQALVSIPMALAIVLAAWNPAPFIRLQDWIAIAVLVVAIGGEATADAQLRRFASDPGNRGKVCDVGLWAWSRHPNYFFQFFGWLAYPLLAIDLAGGYGWGWVALAAPACMYWLLVYISGIPPLEEHMLESRGDAFREYQARTNAFFPAPPAAGRA